MNLGFTNLAFGYKSIPNPGLQPESSNGYELGLRGSAGDSFFAVSAFYNDYDDFIESQAFVGASVCASTPVSLTSPTGSIGSGRM